MRDPPVFHKVPLTARISGELCEAPAVTPPPDTTQTPFSKATFLARSRWPLEKVGRRSILLSNFNQSDSTLIREHVLSANNQAKLTIGAVQGREKGFTGTLPIFGLAYRYSDPEVPDKSGRTNVFFAESFDNGFRVRPRLSRSLG